MTAPRHSNQTKKLNIQTRTEECITATRHETIRLSNQTKLNIQTQTEQRNACLPFLRWTDRVGRLHIHHSWWGKELAPSISGGKHAPVLIRPMDFIAPRKRRRRHTTLHTHHQLLHSHSRMGNLVNILVNLVHRCMGNLVNILVNLVHRGMGNTDLGNNVVNSAAVVGGGWCAGDAAGATVLAAGDVGLGLEVARAFEPDSDQTIFLSFASPATIRGNCRGQGSAFRLRVEVDVHFKVPARTTRGGSWGWDASRPAVAIVLATWSGGVWKTKKREKQQSWNRS